MTSLEWDWQDVLSFAVLATAAGFLALRAYRAAKRGQHDAGCGACLANSGDPGAGPCRAAQSQLRLRNEMATSSPASPRRSHR